MVFSATPDLINFQSGKPHPLLLCLVVYNPRCSADVSRWGEGKCSEGRIYFTNTLFALIIEPSGGGGGGGGGERVAMSCRHN